MVNEQQLISKITWRLMPFLGILYLIAYDLAAVNEESSWTLTMPALYVIRPDGIIEYADISPNYTRRCDPTELFPILNHIRAGMAH